MKTRERRLCVTVLLWLLTIKRVKTDGKLDIRFISYWSDGRESSGYCCDSSYRARCLDKCDPMFILCIDGPDRRGPCSVYKTTTNYIDNHDIILFGGSIQGTPNSFTVHISKAIPSSIQIKVDVYDNDKTSGDDHMDTLSKLINIQAAAPQQESVYTPYTLLRRTTLKIAVRAYCDPDWYGSTCEKYCKASPDHSHYTCHPHTGAKMCFEGWKGDNCNQDIDECTERDHICQTGGSCTNTPGSFECACVAGIKGKLCETIINQCALKPCLNGGTCDGNESDFKCDCPVEWTGETCADKVNFCDSDPCNRGYCRADLLTATRFKFDCDFPWSPHDNLDTNQYVSAILPPLGLVLMSVLLLVAFCIWRRSNKTEQCRDDIQLDSFVMDVACNPQPPGAMTGNLQGVSVSPDGYTSLRFLGSPDTHCDETSNIISLAAEDITLDPETLEGLGHYPVEAHRDDTLNIHLTTEDMSLDTVIIHSFGVSPNDNGRLGDVAKLQPVTEDLTLDPVIEQDARVSPHDSTHDCDEASLHDVQVAALDTHCDEASNALPTTETGALDSMRLSRYPDGHTRLGDFGTLDTRRHVTSYTQPVPGDMTLDPGNLEEEEDNAEYTVIDDNEVEDILQEDPYETIESVDDKNDENISQEKTL